MKILVNGDIHGRHFWKEPCNNIETYDKVVFLGDYLDPYDFEGITVRDAIENFKEIIEFTKSNLDKVVLLLGNHDMPYFSKTYKRFSKWHCRHSYENYEEIAKIFEDNKELFKIAHVEDDVLFTHAGCTSGWLKTVFTEQYVITNLDDLSFSLNNLLNTTKGLSYLYMVSRERGGDYVYGSCIWADVNETYWDQVSKLDGEHKVHDIHNVKQVFGHTLQAFYDQEHNIGYGRPREYFCCKMIDTGNAYILDTEKFKIEQIKKES